MVSTERGWNESGAEGGGGGEGRGREESRIWDTARHLTWVLSEVFPWIRSSVWPPAPLISSLPQAPMPMLIPQK